MRKEASETAVEIINMLQSQAIEDYDLHFDFNAENIEALAASYSMHHNMRNVDYSNPSDVDDKLRAFLAGADEYETQLKGMSEVKTLTPIQNPIDDFMLSSLKEKLSSITGHISNSSLPDGVVLATLPIGQCNAFCLPIEETGEHIILFQNGLFGSLNLMAHVALREWPEDDAGLPLSPDMNELLARILRNTSLQNEFLQYLEAILCSANPGAVKPPIASRIKNLSKEGILQYSELFILAHEYGHIKRGSFTAKKQQNDAKGETLFNSSFTVEARSKQEEFAADMHALEYVTAFGTAAPMAIIHAVQGIQFFFAVQEVFEEALNVLTSGAAKQRVRDSHPDPSDRLAALKAVLTAWIGPQQASAVFDGTGKIREIVQAIWSASQDRWREECRRRDLKASRIWISAVESHVDEKIEIHQSTCKSLFGFDFEEFDGVKVQFLGALFNMASRDDEKMALVSRGLVMEYPHMVWGVLIREFYIGDEEHTQSLIEYVDEQHPGMHKWLSYLKFVVSRYKGNEDILGVPEVLQTMEGTRRFLTAVATKLAEKNEVDYGKEFFEAGVATKNWLEKKHKGVD